MLTELKLYNFPTGYNAQTYLEGNNPFVLSTCQRTLLLTFAPLSLPPEQQIQAQSLSGAHAYYYLLETICGLQSKLIGENEIVGQFKQAYKNYVQSSHRDTKIMRILEKLFKDAKSIRSEYLMGLSHKTYASITRKHTLRAKAQRVLILGSGNLAEDVINQFKKKLPCYIAARNEQKVQELTKKHPLLEVVPWPNLTGFAQFPHIINTIGTEQKILFHDFFTHWAQQHQNKLFVDLGAPSPIQTPYNKDHGIIRLDNIFEEGAIHQSRKKQQIQLAKEAMWSLTQHRHRILKQNKSSKVARLVTA